MSKWTDFRDAAEMWFVHGYHEALTVLTPAATALGKAEMGAILKAGLEAKATGGNANTIKDASMKAGMDAFKSVGVTVGLEALGDLGTLALAHLTTGAPAGQAGAPQ